MRNFKSDFKIIKSAIIFLFNYGLVCVVAFFVWHFTLGHYYPIWGNAFGVISAAGCLILMLLFERTKLPFENLSQEESRHLKNEILWAVTFKAGKRLCKAYNTCNLTRAIDTEFIDPNTGDKYRLIFRRMRNGERMQASHLRKPLPQAEEAKEDLFIEAEGDWQPGQWQTDETKSKENKAGSIEATTASDGVHEIAEAVFGSAPPLRN